MLRRICIFNIYLMIHLNRIKRVMNAKVILLSFYVAFSVSASVTVTESNTQRLSFIFEMEGFSISKYKIGNAVFSQISFKDENTKIYGDGEVALPSQSLFIGIPQSGTATGRFVSHEVKRITLDYPLRAENKDTVGFEYITPTFDNTWMSKIEYVHFRDMRTGRFYIRPFLYDPSTRVLTILIKGSCTITFPPATRRAVPSGAAKSDYYAMLKYMVLNYDIAKSWIFSKNPALRRRQRSYLPANERMLWFQIGDGNDDVNEATTNENGIVKITGSDISSFFGSSVPMSRIALFGSYREELDSVVPLVSEIPDGVREIPLMRFDLNKNGICDANDYILAYVTGISDWYYAKIIY